MDSHEEEIHDDDNRPIDRERGEERHADRSQPDTADPQADGDTTEGADLDRLADDQQLTTDSHVDFLPGTQGELFTAQVIQQRSGPLPDPGELAGFENVLPGAADRIVTMAQQAQAATIALNTRMADAEASSLKFAAYATASLPYALGVLGIAFAYFGQDVGATVAGIAAAVGLGPQLISAIKSRNTPK